MATPKSKKAAHEDEKPRAVPFPSLNEDVPTLYINHLQVIPTAWEFTLRVGELITGPETRVIEKLRLQISPPFAKAMVRVLVRQIEVYEQQIGPIIDVGGVAQGSPES